jgi:predicted acyltransferase
MEQLSLETEKTFLAPKPKRLFSVDIARGCIVALSVLLINMPYAFAKHAEWYGMTLADLVFPAFSTIFGLGLGIAHFYKIQWGKLLRRTFLFILAGLLYNAMIVWSVDFSTLRLTGVLQLYAINGLMATLVLSLNRSWQFPLFWAAIIMISYGTALYLAGQSCAGGLVHPECNPLAKLDAAVFGMEHMYAQGRLGHDPEGLAVIYSALANVFLGAAAGRVLISPQLKKKSLLLFLIGVSLLTVCYFLSFFTPIGKKLWTPAFVALTAGIVILLTAFLYKILDEKPSIFKGNWVARPGLYLLEAYGRNSLFVYFGVYFVVTALAHNRLIGTENSEPMRDKLIESVSMLPGEPQLNYALLFFVLWTVLVAIMHRFKWYVRI